MKNRNDYAKIITITTAFLLAFLVLSVNALPLSAQTTSTPVTLTMPKQVGLEDPMYKYLNHVPVTQYEWKYARGNLQSTAFSQTPNAPETDHLLWVDTLCRYAEALLQTSIIVNGLIIVSTDTTKSIYPGVTFALDQNSGKIVWSIPTSTTFNKIGGVLFGGSTAYDPNTGKALYTLSRAPTSYDPALQMAWANGPVSTPFPTVIEGVGTSNAGGPTIAGYSWPDLTKSPTQVWLSNVTGDDGGLVGYDNGKIFSIGYDDFHMTCYDAKTGAILWQKMSPANHLDLQALGYGKIYCTSYSGAYCFDQETGKLVWQMLGHETNAGMALAYGRVYFYETRNYFRCLDANDGHVIWQYAPIRKIPHWCGPSTDCNHTMHHSAFYRCAVADGKVYATTMQKTTMAMLYPPNYPGIEYEGVRYWVNPMSCPVIAHAGENEFVCLDAETGKVVWRAGYGWPYGPNTGTADKPAYAGPDMGHTVIADGKVYGIEQPYSSHTGIGSSRQETDPLERYPESKTKYHLSHIWYPGRVYCFGPGPVQITMSTDKKTASSGQSVTISGIAVDMSPAMKYAPAVKLPVYLSYAGAAQGAIANVVTDKNGAFSATWTPSTSGTYTIVASSQGSSSYEAPQDVITTITVSGGVTLSTIGSIAGIVAVTVSAAAITVPTRRRKREGGEQLE